MEDVIKSVLEVWAALPVWLPKVEALLLAVVAIALMIPGEQPEKALQSIVDFLKKFSKK